MRAGLDLVPRNVDTCAVLAEHRAGGVFRVALGIVADGGDDALRVRAGLVAAQGAAQTSASAGVGRDLTRVAAQSLDRREAGEHRSLADRFRCVRRAAHRGKVGHRTSHAFRRQLKTEIIERLEQHALGLHQTLPHGAVGRLPEIAALGVLEVRAAREECHFYVGQRAARQHAGMRALGKVRENETLPVEVQLVRRTGGGKLNTAPARGGLEQQMHLGVVAQRLEVPDALDGVGNGLLVNDAALAERDGETEAVGYETLQNFQLHLAHQLGVQLAGRFLPHDAEHRVLVLQLAQLREDGVRVCAVGQEDAVGQNALQHRLFAVRLRPEPLPWIGVRKARDRHNLARACRVERTELRAGVKPELVGLAAGKLHFCPQCPAGDLQVREPCALRVAGDLKDARAEVRAARRLAREAREQLQKLRHALIFERGAEAAGENFSRGDQSGERVIRKRAALQQLLESRFVGQRGVLVAHVRLRAEIDARAEALLQIRQQRRAVRASKVHLVDKEERRHAVALQQPPERAGVALHAVRAADDKDRVVEHLQGALCFGGEIDVARRIEQRDVRAAAVEHRLLGKDGDAALALERFGVQKGVAVIDAAERAQRARGI